MTQVPEPEHINFFLEHLGKLLGAAAGALLLAMQYISRSKKAEIARAVLTDTPVSHAELSECKFDIIQIISEEFKETRKEFRNEIKDLYKHIGAQRN